MAQQQSTTTRVSSKNKKAIIANSRKGLKPTSCKHGVSKKCKNTTKCKNTSRKRKVVCADCSTVETTIGDLICAIYDSAEGVTQNQQLMGELIQHILVDVMENKRKTDC